jgi:hypothetical protein
MTFAPKIACAAVAMALPTAAGAVGLAADGRGQALIYPYYTTRAVNGDAWNTYLSVVNQTGDAKAVRVNVREGRNGRAALSFNLYLAPNDVWTGALAPAGATADLPARATSADLSCTSPRVDLNGITFSNADYTGSRDDGMGAGLDRTREGYVEMIEMATITGPSAVAITHVNGFPPNCAAVTAAGYVPPSSDIHAPTGGLAGTVTLINVNSGMDVGMDAVALSNLTVGAFFRAAGDPYPDFDAAEVTPIANVATGNSHYRLTFARGADAVSAVLMRRSVMNEFVLDTVTASTSAWVMTFPTRRFYVAGASPFAGPNPGCVSTALSVYDREGIAQPSCGVPGCATKTIACYASTVIDWSKSSLFGSTNNDVLADLLPSSGRARATLGGAAGLDNGNALRSGADSIGWNIATGVNTTSKFDITGLPVVGFAARTFKNGTLSCGGTGACQGNYGGSFDHHFDRLIQPVP